MRPAPCAAALLLALVSGARGDDADTPLARWTMDGTGPVAQDDSGNDLNGTLAGVRRIGSPGHGALRFEGAGWVELGGAAAVRLSLDDGEPFSLALWFQLPESRGVRGTHTLIGKGGPEGLLLQVARGGRLVLTADHRSVAGRTVVADGEWHHVAVAVGPEGLTSIYLDGAPEVQNAGPTRPAADPAARMYIGKTATPQIESTAHLRGAVDDVRIYRRALTREEAVRLASRRDALVRDPATAAVYETIPLPVDPSPFAVPGDLLRKLDDGDPDGAIDDYETGIQYHPDVAEYDYALALAHAANGDIPTAMEHVRRATSGGLPLARFVAGPRKLTDPLTRSDAFRERLAAEPVQLVHGPLLGSVTDSAARFWVRTARPAALQVELREPSSAGSPRRSARVRSDPASEHVAVLEIEGLSPATTYVYELIVDGKKHPRQWEFRTSPARGAPARFEIGFGGCAAYTPRSERMWSTIAARGLQAFLLLGDNVYIDNPLRPALQQYCYYRRQSHPEFRDLVATTPTYAIWDDHDFGSGDAWGGPQTDRPAWKRPVWRTFRNQWNNPAYGGGERQPGCWFAFSIADVDLFLLDGRTYRSAPAAGAPTMLGPAQKQWLFERLRDSTATFKLLVSPVPWSFAAKQERGGRDTWRGFAAEREEIFSFLETHRIEGVLLVSADRHRSEAWRIRREAGYDLYEFESSKLTTPETHDPVEGTLFAYAEKNSFGLLSFDTTAAVPQVTYSIVSIDDETDPALQLTVRRSDLELDE